jgi:hypothetical protein
MTTNSAQLSCARDWDEIGKKKLQSTKQVEITETLSGIEEPWGSMGGYFCLSRPYLEISA